MRVNSKTSGQLRRRKKGGTWYYQVYLGNGNRWERSTGTTDLRLARKRAAELYAVAELLSGAPKTSSSLDEMIVHEVQCVESDISTNQAQCVRYALVNFRKFVGNVPVERITTAVLDEYQRERLKQASRRTVRMELQFVCRMLRRNGIEIEKPTIKAGKETPVRAFTEKELPTVFKHTPERFKCLYLTLLATGARPTELMPSTRSTHVPLLKREVDFERGTILIRTAKRKAGEHRKQRLIRLPVDSVLFPMLRHQMNETEGPHVFPSQSNTARNFNLVLKQAGIPKVNELGEVLRLHSFRHTHATLMAEKVNQFVVKAALGHSQLSTTDRYVHPATPVIPIPLDALVNASRWKNPMESRRPVKSVRLVSA